MQQDGDTARDDRSTVREDGATVRENSATVREDGATVREDGATVREGPGPSPPSDVPSPEEQAAGWLPPVLAANWRVDEALPARGGEADLYVVDDRNAGIEAGARRVAKVYRQGMVPKQDVLDRIRQADPAHVVRLESFGEDSGRWWELMEYVEHGSMRQLLEREGPKLPEDLILDVLRQVNDALAGLHRLPLEHRDLKPGNVLVRSREPLDLILSDFGISSVMDASVHFTQTARTARYGPPESVSRKVMIERTRWDYWSLGMILVEMLRGEHPYDGLSEAVISNQLLTQDVEELTENISDPDWRKLCRGLLRRTPTHRWDGEAVSKWLADPNDPSLNVAAEATRSTTDVPPRATIAFDGARYRTPEELGLALAKDWDKAKSFWTRRFRDLRTWVTDELGLNQLGDLLARIDSNDGMDLETQVFSCVYLLAPNSPTVRYRGVEMSMEGLAALGERAIQGDAEARTTLFKVYRQKILMLAGSMQGREALADVPRRWEEAVNEYGRLNPAPAALGAEAPEPDDDALLVLLAGGILSPDVPLRYCDVELSEAGLAALGERAGDGDAEARTTLFKLYRKKILALAGSVPGREALADVPRRWEEAVNEYGRLNPAPTALGAEAPELDDDALMVLLTAGILSADAPLRYRDVALSEAGLAALAERASQGDAGACAILFSLYRQRILMLVGSLPGREALADLPRVWSKGVDDYDRVRSEAAAQGVVAPELDDDRLLILLAAGILGPDAPLRIGGVDISMKGLASLGDRASQGDAGARATLLEVYHGRLLLVAGALPGKKALADLPRRWDEAVNEYERLRDRYAAQGVETPVAYDDVLVALLSGSVPSPAALAGLRAAARKASTANARACPWFRELGRPRNASVAALIILPHLQAAAEPVGKTLRTRPIRGCMWGLFVGALFGFQVMWGHVMFVFEPDDFFYHPGLTILLGVLVTFAFYRAFRCDLRDAAAQKNAAGEARRTKREGSGPIGRAYDKYPGPMGCLTLIVLPFAAIFALAIPVMIVGLTSVPSLLAMDLVGLIDFGKDELGAHRGLPPDIRAVSTSDGTLAVFSPLLNTQLYVVPHALLGAIIGIWPRRRRVVSISILAFIVLCAVLHMEDPMYLLFMWGG